jgi:hypothetical protein
MGRGFGRLAAVLMVGLGAGTFDAHTSATGPAQPAARGVLDSRRTQDADPSSQGGLKVARFMVRNFFQPLD